LPNNCTAPSGTQPCRRRQLLDWLHRPDRWLVASQYQLFRWQPMPLSVLVWVRILLNQMFLKQCTVRQYHSDLSYQSALEI